MDRRTVTFMVISNRKGDTKRVVVSTAWLKAAIALVAVLTVIASACVVDYVGLLAQSIENKRLRSENSQLKQQFSVVEGKLNALESGLERVKGFVAKLKLITDVDGEDRTLKLAIGPLPKTGQSVDGEGMEIASDPNSASSGKRGTASVGGAAQSAEEHDSVFFQKPPADELEGELSVEGQRDYASLAIRMDQAVQETNVREQGVLELWETLSQRQSLISATPNITPARVGSPQNSVTGFLHSRIVR